jgi:hypothetical protein
MMNAGMEAVSYDIKKAASPPFFPKFVIGNCTECVHQASMMNAGMEQFPMT